jgi:hypothetical protein
VKIHVTVETEDASRVSTFTFELPETDITQDRWNKIVKALESRVKLEESLGRLREFGRRRYEHYR